MNQQDTLGQLKKLARILDSAIGIPKTKYKIGLDGILGLVPVIGDFLTLIPALYIIYEGQKLGATTKSVIEMLLNVGLEALVGSVPIIGDFYDFAWKANNKNIKIIENDLAQQAKTLRNV